VKSLYRTCAGHFLFPRPLRFELHGDLIGVPLYHGGSANLFKREFRGQEVAVKVLRVRAGSCPQNMTNVGHRGTVLFSCTCWLTERHVYRSSARRS